MPLTVAQFLMAASSSGPPTATVAPSISGTAQIGSTLTASSGTWSGGYAGPFVYRWKCNGVTQPSEGIASYYVPESNVGLTITCEVYPAAYPAQASTSAATSAVAYPGVRTDFKTWSADARWVYSKTAPISSTETRLTITGGSGWTTTAREATNYVASFNVSDPPNQSIAFFTTAFAAAGATGGEGWMVDARKNRRVSIAGNSLAGYDPTEGFVAQYQALLNARGDYRWNMHRTSSAGWTIDNLEANKATFLASYQPSYAKKFALVWEITNTLYYGQTKETTLSKHRSFCADAKAAGFYVVILTCMPRSDASTPSTFEADRLWVNAQLLADTSQIYYDEVLDVCADARLGATGAELNATYFRDRVHLTQAGFAIVADQVFNLILTR